MNTDNTRMFIPKIINVGYQEREDTYTGKLAYVVYTDEKGVIRKETSWNNWCHSSLGKDIFDNTPTSGFVLNKHVGGYKSDWNFRHSYCRVYDPRGFEFEISIENLLFILDNCNCMVGKGLEGEFVYAWQGTDLVLIPVNTETYTKASEYTSVIAEGKTFTKKDLQIGDIYKDKNDKCYVYLGEYCKYSDFWSKEPGTNLGKYLFFCTVPFSELNIESSDSLKINTDTYDIRNSYYSFTYQKSIGKKFIQKLDYKYPFTDILFDCLSHKEEFSPVEKIVIKYFTKEEFTEYIKSSTGCTRDFINGNGIIEDGGYYAHTNSNGQYYVSLGHGGYAYKNFETVEEAVYYVFSNIKPAYACVCLENGKSYKMFYGGYKLKEYKEYVQYE